MSYIISQLNYTIIDTGFQDHSRIVFQKVILSKYAADNGFINPVFFIDDGVDSAKGDYDFTPFRNLFNDFYAKDTSKKVRAIKKAQGMAREHLTKPPFQSRTARLIFWLGLLCRVNEFIKKIIVHAPEKVNDMRFQKVDIVFNFIGEIHSPTDPQTEQKATKEQEKTA